MTGSSACLEILAALRRAGAISSEDERLLLAECRSLNRSSADSASAPGSRLTDAEYWSLRFVHDLSDALQRSGWIDGVPRAALCADDVVLAQHEEALCARLGSAFATR
jgi:hypothetical protein